VHVVGRHLLGDELRVLRTGVQIREIGTIGHEQGEP
jgi:hypothetical protein